MLLPATFVPWMNTLFAKLALNSTLRLRFNTIMRFKVFHSKHTFAFRAKLIFRTLFAFLQKMLIKAWNFNYLAAFPALSKHRTIFPIMNIKRFLIESVIVASTETASLIFWSFKLSWFLISFYRPPLLIWRWILNISVWLFWHWWLLILLKILFFIIFICFSRRCSNCRFFSSSTSSSSFPSVRINIGYYRFFWSFTFSCSFLWRSSPISSIYFSKRYF